MTNQEEMTKHLNDYLEVAPSARAKELALILINDPSYLPSYLALTTFLMKRCAFVRVGLELLSR